MGGVVQPTGTVTLLFSDIEGSTRLLQLLGRERYAEALALHRRLLRGAFERHGGYEVDYEGDAFFVAFARAEEAVAAAAEAQQALATAGWPEGEPFRVRMGLHTGEPLPAPPKYVGLDVHQAARIMAAGHGGQVLVSEVTRRLCEQEPGRFAFRDLGEHRLKDLSGPQRLYQLLIEGLPEEFPALKTLGNRPTNLPVQPNRLIGRERELAEIAGLLTDGQTRLLTLTGPGGTGKTRLALEAAAELVDDFPDGVYFISLAPVREAALVLPTIAQTLGLREQPGVSLEETLGEYLAPRRMLLVLDNFEHVLKAAGDVAALLDEAARLKLLVTSRAPLRLSAESEYLVEPLGLPQDRSPARAARSDAVALFAERTRAVRRGFRLNESNVVVVAEICRRLDGLPLAIELAAARGRVFPPDALLRHLDSRFEFLSGGARDAPERQRTLRATIDWSYQLLDDEERLVLARLGVFAGGFTLGAARAVCDPDHRFSAGVLDVCFSLVEQSLVSESGEASDGEPRFSLLETIREYAFERLRAIGEATECGRRHAEFYAQFAADAEAALRGSAQKTWLETLDREHDNLRAAIAYALRSDPELALRLTAAMSRFWDLRGHWHEGIGLTRRALDLAEGAPPSLVARARHAAGLLGNWVGERRSAVADLGEAIRLGRQSREDWVTTQALAELAIALETIDTAGARRAATEAVELAAELGDPWLKAFSYHALSTTLDQEGAFAALQEARALYEQAGDALKEAGARCNLSWHALHLERNAQAVALAEEAIVAAERFGDRYLYAAAHNNAAMGHLFDSRVDAANEALHESLTTLTTLSADPLSAEALYIASGLHATACDNDLAGYLLGAADAALARLQAEPDGLERRIGERLIAPTRARDRDQFAAAYNLGQRATLRDALDRALADERYSALHD